MYVATVNRRLLPPSEVIQQGVEVVVSGVDFLDRLASQQHAHVQSDEEITVVEGGALQYNSSAGPAFLWFRGVHSTQIQPRELSLLVSVLEPYVSESEGADVLFGGDEAKGWFDTTGGYAHLKDINFIRGALNKAKDAYIPKK